MNLTQKEIDFLDDFKTQEKLCIEKYDRYSACACSTELKSLFGELADRERGHLKTINEMSGGTVADVPPTVKANNCNCGCAGYCDENSRKNDSFLCSDMLASEKHASGLYIITAVIQDFFLNLPYFLQLFRSKRKLYIRLTANNSQPRARRIHQHSVIKP